ncbi:MAG: hypothetical protein CMJ87_03185 [Planctomycetes bacterium]|nr:hypothetical protein [Planctomycetota bacterium]
MFLSPTSVPALLALVFFVPGMSEGRMDFEPDVQATAPDQPLQAPLIFQRFEGVLPITVPRREELRFGVYLHLGPLGDPMAGEFVMGSGSEPFLRGLPLPGSSLAADERLESGWVHTRVTGSALGYKLDHNIDVRLLPQAWPALIYTDTQRGSENRRRELRLGQIAGKHIARYRRDHHCGGCERAEHLVKGLLLSRREHHCEDCDRLEHRVWRAESEREIPPGAIDMLSAIYMARSMRAVELEAASFAVLDKLELWNTTISMGERRVLELPAGRFACRKMVMETSSADEGEGAFSGLFGIHGEIDVWVHDPSGVPVRIAGAVPLGPFDLKVTIDLRSYSGTPADFAPLAD